MKREILFRGKRVDNGEWIEGFFAKSGDKTFILIDNDIAVGYVAMKEVIAETVGQFTGLTDKNGTKIFEGDIIKEKDCVHNGEIQIVGDVWQVCFKDGVFFAHNKMEAKFVYWLKNFEVIGNIYDNPELMDKEEKEDAEN